MLIAFIAATITGNSAFYATNFNLILGGKEDPEVDIQADGTNQPTTVGEIRTSYVALPQLIVSIGAGPRRSQLKFGAQIEVKAGTEKEIESLIPQFTDVLNVFLRSVGVDQIERPTVLIELRGHLKHRLALVAGPDKILNILITEFVLV
ncbi:flagellar basal body-associated FliL family protein [Pseudooceanicola sp. C21-150M6]